MNAQCFLGASNRPLKSALVFCLFAERLRLLCARMQEELTAAKQQGNGIACQNIEDKLSGLRSKMSSRAASAKYTSNAADNQTEQQAQSESPAGVSRGERCSSDLPPPSNPSLSP